MEALMIDGCYVKPSLVSLKEIKIGDTVLHCGGLKTVSNTSLRYDDFMGFSLFGDTYHIKRKVIKCKIFNGVSFK